MVGLPNAIKFEDMFSGVDRIRACNRQTDRWTDRHLSCHGINM